jgi:hypothetical protein
MKGGEHVSPDGGIAILVFVRELPAKFSCYLKDRRFLTEKTLLRQLFNHPFSDSLGSHGYDPLAAKF